jgi:RHS repeat-associated protein
VVTAGLERDRDALEDPVAAGADLQRRFSYDDLGRLTARWTGTAAPTDAGARDVEVFGYDLASNQVCAAGSGGMIRSRYDAVGRLDLVQSSAPSSPLHAACVLTDAQATSGPGGTPSTDYLYDDVSGGEVRSVTDNALTTTDKTTTYTYDDLGRIDTVNEPFTAGLYDYGFDAAGRLVTRKDPGWDATTPTGLKWTWSYKPITGRLETYTVERGNVKVLDTNLNYDLAGNVTSRAQFLKAGQVDDSWTYDHDGASRLITADGPGIPAVSYDYDGASNRYKVTEGTSTLTTTFDAAGLPTVTKNGTGTVVSTYATGPEGQLLSLMRPATGHEGGPDLCMAYDAWGRMIASTQGNLTSCPTSPAPTYAIDGLGRHVSATFSGSTTTTAYRGLTEDPVALSTTGMTDPLQYSWGPTGPLVATAGTTERVLVTDAHGDVVASTTVGDAQVAGTRTYTAWGETRTDTAGFSRPVELGFQSDPTASATGLVDVGIRHLLPGVGRFSTRDVLFGDVSSPVSLNQYLYGGANPVTMADPTGMASRNGVGARVLRAQQCAEARAGFCSEDTSNPLSERIWGTFAVTASVVVVAAAPEIAMWAATRAAPVVALRARLPRASQLGSPRPWARHPHGRRRGAPRGTCVPGR